MEAMMTSDLKPLRERIGFAVTRGQSWVTVRVDDLQPLLADNERLWAALREHLLSPRLNCARGHGPSCDCAGDMGRAALGGGDDAE